MSVRYNRFDTSARVVYPRGMANLSALGRAAQKKVMDKLRPARERSKISVEAVMASAGYRSRDAWYTWVNLEQPANLPAVADISNALGMKLAVDVLAAGEPEGGHVYTPRTREAQYVAKMVDRLSDTERKRVAKMVKEAVTSEDTDPSDPALDLEGTDQDGG